MDPLSISASVLTVVGAISSTSRIVKKIASLRGAPEAISALNNEISDLQLVLRAVETMLQSNTDSVKPFTDNGMQELLDRAKGKLLELDILLEYQIMTVDDNKKPKINFPAWARKQGKIRQLQQDLRSARLNLATIVGSLASSVSLRAEASLHQIRGVVNSIYDEQQSIQVETLNNHAKAHWNAEDVRANQPLNSNRIIQRPSLITATLNPFVPKLRSHSENDLDCRATRISVSYKRPCISSCRCACHRRQRLRSPQLFDKILGSLFLGYVGLPIASLARDTNCCRLNNFILSLDYYFPAWFFRRKVHLEIRHGRNLGPEQLLRISRLVPVSSEIIRWALQGNIEGMKSVLREGRGSPFDTGGAMTPIIVATQQGHAEVCQMLLHAGADPYEEDQYNKSASRIALDTILIRREKASIIANLRTVFSDTIFLEEQLFTCLHKVILGLICLDLSILLSNLSRSDINQGDINNRSALFWAVLRGDSHATKLLLEHGADPNITPSYGNPIFRAATRSGDYSCVRLLLRAGARTDGLGPNGVTALGAAVLYMDNVDILSILLEYGVNLDHQNRTGETAFMWACLYGRPKTVTFLIQHKANVRLLNNDGGCALHYAISGDHPTIVRLLLEEGIDYRPKSKTAGTILHLAAQVGSLDVLKELARAGLPGVDIEDRFNGFTALEYAERRVDVPLKWIESFKNLLHSAARDSNATLTEHGEADEVFHDSVELLELHV